jgi:HPt (histidine-containing phosphotransfer) domain-containing protein
MSNWDAMELATPDMDRLSEIFDMDDPDDVELLGELLDTVLGEAPEALQQLMTSRTSGDGADVGAIAHRLKSSFGNLGFMNASQLFQRIMEEQSGDNSAAMNELVHVLEESTEKLLQGVQDFRDQL